MRGWCLGIGPYLYLYRMVGEGISASQVQSEEFFCDSHVTFLDFAYYKSRRFNLNKDYSMSKCSSLSDVGRFGINQGKRE